ncbi:hypothetical protein ElyMa_000197900 [Elysia marginata]|uniref:Peptidase aspartic putative domain-containing protein n=1 Tax=Elysia marginata TaxID=1093978 RepID=A0AAV4EVT4_9GAST|nr:hypothetical protein ElyMa_000197900 [Elysia marginata]
MFALNLGGVDLQLAEIDNICRDMYREAVPKSILRKFNLIFNDDLEVDRTIKVDILIGLDYYWELVGQDVVQFDSLVAQKTRCGWMLSGCYIGESKREGHQLLCKGNMVSDQVVKSLWELDSIGIKDDASPVKDQISDHFEKNITYGEGRYCVSLSWKEEDKGKLMNNKFIASKRLQSLSRRLEGNPELKKAYDENLAEMERSGIIREASSRAKDGPVFYLPHHPVLREDSRTTEVRPVFDASAKGYNAVSLNDSLEAGPNLLPNILKVLLRFRRWKVAVISDVAKAFVQI